MSVLIAYLFIDCYVAARRGVFIGKQYADVKHSLKPVVQYALCILFNVCSRISLCSIIYERVNMHAFHCFFFYQQLLLFLFISQFPLFFTDVILNSVCQVLFTDNLLQNRFAGLQTTYILQSANLLCVCGQMLSYFNIKIYKLYKVIFYCCRTSPFYIFCWWHWPLPSKAEL